MLNEVLLTRLVPETHISTVSGVYLCKYTYSIVLNRHVLKTISSLNENKQ